MACAIKQRRGIFSFTRILKHNSSSYTFYYRRDHNYDETSATYTVPACMPINTNCSLYVSRGYTYADWFGSQYNEGWHTTYICQNGSKVLADSGSKTVKINPGDKFYGYIYVVSYNWARKKDRGRTNSTYYWSAPVSVSENTIYYYNGTLNVFPSTGISTTELTITGKATVSLPMTAGASWTSGVAQYYKLASYAMKAISSQMTASSHVAQGGTVAFTRVDTGTQLSIAPTSISITSGTNLQASDGSTSVVFTAEALQINGASQNPYIRDLVIRVGYW